MKKTILTGLLMAGLIMTASAYTPNVKENCCAIEGNEEAFAKADAEMEAFIKVIDEMESRPYDWTGLMCEVAPKYGFSDLTQRELETKFEILYTIWGD